MRCKTQWAQVPSWSFCRWTPRMKPLAALWWMESRRAMAIWIFWSTQLAAMPAEKQLWETDPKTYQLMLTLNLHAGFNLARTVVPAMLKQKSGSIVNIASKAALDHAAGAGAYAASKAAALALFDCLAQDVKGSGVRVNSVLPSIIDTEPNRKAMPTADFSKWPKPEEIAQVILFLCSPEAKLIHGAAIPVYGES